MRTTACLVMLALAACSEPERLRLLSYNVNFGLAGDIAGVRAIGQAKADIVVLQETNPAWERALIETLGRRYPHVRFADPDGMPAGGLGVMSKFPIREVQTLPSDGGFFVAWRIVVDTNLGRIQILDVHLRPPTTDDGNYVVGLFSTRDDRLRELTKHMASLDPGLPAVIAGDFNEQGDGLALQYATQRGFTDAIAERHGSKRTWRWRLPGGMTIEYQLDHILVDNRLRSVASEIREVGRSDHFPIWADLERR